MCLCICLTIQTRCGAAITLQLEPEYESQSFSGGRTGLVRVTWHNLQNQKTETRLRLQLFQTSFSTAAPISEQLVETVVTLAGQTVVQTNAVYFPDVRAESRFAIRWIDQRDNIVGSTEVSVFPGDLLKKLNELAGNGLIGCYDPEQRIMPVLAESSVQLDSFESDDSNAFIGRLVVIGPFNFQRQTDFDLVATLEQLTRHGVGIVWIQPPSELADRLKPSFYIVNKNAGAIVIVQNNFVRDLANSPRAQSRLIELCRLALKPEPFSLPHNRSQKTKNL